MLRVAADDERVKVLVTAAGHYRDYEGDLMWRGSEEALADLRARGQKAKNKYEQTGKIDYVPAIDLERTDVGMPGKPVYAWYAPWIEASTWENRYAVMSDADLFAYESLSAAKQLNKPYLMIHSDNSFLPPAAKRHFEAVPTEDKKLQWEGETGHFQYYDDPVVMDRTVSQVNAWLRRHLDMSAPASAYITY